MRTHEVTTADGINLHVDDHGPEQAPAIVLVHGFAQSRLSWMRQITGELADSFRLVMPDLRGHGRSDKPDDIDGYTCSATLAGDLAAVFEQLHLVRPVLAAWSYSGLMACDYLRHYGTQGLSGVALVAARSKVGSDSARAMSGKLFLELAPGFVSHDATARIAAIARFLDNLTYAGICDPDFCTMLGFNTLTPPAVCAALLARVADNDDVLSTLDIPVWVVHGDRDTSILPAMAEHHAALIPGAQLSLYADVGHAPFYECAERFNAELIGFAQRCFANA